MDIYSEEKRKVKMFIYQSKVEANKQFGKMNQGVSGKTELF